jgi:hypothetical protein
MRGRRAEHHEGRRDDVQHAHLHFSFASAASVER